MCCLSYTRNTHNIKHTPRAVGGHFQFGTLLSIEGEIEHGSFTPTSPVSSENQTHNIQVTSPIL